MVSSSLQGSGYLEVLEARRLMAAGDLDTTFNPGGLPPGTATTAPPTPAPPAPQLTTFHAKDVAVYANGTTVMVGDANFQGRLPGGLQLQMLKYLNNGSLDTSFDSDGKLVVDINNPGVAEVSSFTSLGLDGNGTTMYVGGNYATNSGINSQIVLTRLQTNGAVINTITAELQPNGVYKGHTNGDMVVVPTAFRPTYGHVIMVGRAGDNLHSPGIDGTHTGLAFFDASASTVVADEFGTSGADPRDVALLADGNLVIATVHRDLTLSNDPYKLRLYRYVGSRTSGTFTPYTGDIILPANDPYPVAMDVLNDGRVVVAFADHSTSPPNTYNIRVARYNPTTMAIDPYANADPDGAVTISVPSNGFSEPLQIDVAAPRDNTVVVGTTASTPAPQNLNSFALFRLNTSGALDTTFGGGDGMVITPMQKVVNNEVEDFPTGVRALAILNQSKQTLNITSGGQGGGGGALNDSDVLNLPPVPPPGGFLGYKIIAAGQMDFGSTEDAAIARYLGSGSNFRPAQREHATFSDALIERVPALARQGEANSERLLDWLFDDQPET